MLCHAARQMRAGTGDRMNDTIIIERSDILARDEDNWLKGVWLKVRSRWWLVLATAMLGLLTAVVYLRAASYSYTVELRVSAAESSRGISSGADRLGGLASLAGLAGEAPSASPFRLYLEGVKSREVAERLARDRALLQGVFAREWDPVRRTWRQPRGFAGSIRSTVWGLLGVPQFAWTPPGPARLQNYIADNVAVVQSVKSPLVSITLQIPDPKFGMRFLTHLDATTDDILRERQQQRTRSNIAYLSDKLRGVTFVEQRAALFKALSDEQRQEMLANSRAPYAADRFGVPTASLAPTTPRQVPLLIAGPLIGTILGVVLALLIARRRRAVLIDSVSDD
jgi:uncharacterized protein involved in exopolysaccharide biosynthesis